MTKRKWKVGDRVINRFCDPTVLGTVVEVGYNDIIKVQYDDGVIGNCLARDLANASLPLGKD